MLDDYHFYGSGHKPDKSKMILNDISYDNQGNFELKYLIEKEIPIASQFGDTNTKKIQTNIKTFKFSVLSKVKEEIEKIINKFDQNVDLSEIDVPNKIFPSDVKTNDKIDFKFKDFFNNDWLSVFEIKIKEIIPNDKDGYFICKYEINSKQFPELKKVFEAKSGNKNLYDKKQVKTNVKFKKDLWEELTNPNNTYEEFNQKRNSFFEEISSNPNSDIAIQNLKKLFELSLDKKFNDSRIKYVDGIFKLQTKMIIGKETNGDYKYEYVDVLNLNIESIKEKIKDSIYKYRHYTIMEKVFKDNDIISILNDPSFHEIKPDLSKIKNEIAKWKNDFYNNFLEQGYTISDEWLGGQFNFKLSQVLNIIEVDKLYSEIFTKVGNIDYSKRAEISELIKNRYTKNDPWIH